MSPGVGSRHYEEHVRPFPYWPIVTQCSWKGGGELFGAPLTHCSGTVITMTGHLSLRLLL
jgi:hypothetical protein